MFDDTISAIDYNGVCERWLSKGVQVIGGCCAIRVAHIKEPLNKSGRMKFEFKMVKIQARYPKGTWNANNSLAIAKFCNAKMD